MDETNLENAQNFDETETEKQIHNQNETITDKMNQQQTLSEDQLQQNLTEIEQQSDYDIEDVDSEELVFEEEEDDDLINEFDYLKGSVETFLERNVGLDYTGCEEEEEAQKVTNLGANLVKSKIKVKINLHHTLYVDLLSESESESEVASRSDSKSGSESEYEADQQSEHDEQQQNLIYERQQLIQQRTQLYKQLRRAISYQHELRRKNREADAKIAKLSEQIKKQISEIDHLRPSSPSASELSDYTASQVYEEKSLTDDMAPIVFYTTSDKEMEIGDLQTRIKSDLNDIREFESDLKDERNKYKKMAQKYRDSMKQFRKLLANCNKTAFRFEETQQLFHKQTTDFKEKLKEINGLKNDLNQLKKEKQLCEKRYEQLEIENNNLNQTKKQKESSEKRINQLEDRNNALIRSENGLKEQIENLKKRIHASTVNKDKDESNKATIKQTVEIVREEATLTQTDEEKQQNFVQIVEPNSETEPIINNKTYLNIVKRLKYEKNCAIEEQSILKKKIDRVLDEIQRKKREIHDLKEKLNSTTDELNELNTQFLGALDEKCTVRRPLVQSKSDVEQLKNKLKMYNHQIKRMRGDIKTKLQELMRKENVVKKVLKEEKHLKAELDLANGKIKTLTAEVSELEIEQELLRKTVTDIQRLNCKQSETVEKLEYKRGATDRQIVRRNDEITLLNEKMKPMKVAIKSAEKHNKQLLDDLQSLKTENSRLRQIKNLKDKTMEETNILEEQTTLQEELNNAKRVIREQEKRIKCLRGELNMVEWKSEQYQSDLQRINGELQDFKEKFFGVSKEQKMQ